MVVMETTQSIRIQPLASEGFFDALGVIDKQYPSSFVAEVGAYGPTEGWPGAKGWGGKVVEGHPDWIGCTAILRQRIENFCDAVVAYVFDDQGNEIFSGICDSKGLK